MTVVTEVVIVTSFSKNTLTLWQPTNSHGSFSQLLRCLATLSSSRSLVVGLSVGLETFVKKWPLEYQMVTKTYLPSNLFDGSDGSDSSDSSYSNESSDSSDSNDSSDSSDKQSCFTKKHRKSCEKLPWELVGCQGVKVFLLKDVIITTSITTVIFITITIWVFELSQFYFLGLHNLSFWVWSQFDLSSFVNFFLF